MNEYERLIAFAVRDKLKERVKGRVFCKIEDDCLYIEIRTSELDIFTYRVYDFANKFLTGDLNTDSIADSVINQYKKVILSKFLYN